MSDVTEGSRCLPVCGGELTPGNYPEGTLFARVQAKLDTYAQHIKAEQRGRRYESREGDCPGCGH